ncbi:DUF1043 family protein [Nitrogeniibacter mangrovi]|uniref:Z-ring associated protein G n=1 Tax=Nitrogeniibacter mangrovi TaxID=2016596 RepID=A0A6C1B0X9_9RHOO|nr:DUF1043 family protein [Nitrogeniibacter mangrovi]QID17266.1 DUF1043 family protein [Nitrogeniibacter mangrovi]
MTTEIFWPVLIVGVLVALAVGFLIGRFAGGVRKRADGLAAELEQQKDEAARYRKAVDEHFEETATLFASMAGSYKALFNHLSTSHKALSADAERDLFRDRVGIQLAGAEVPSLMIAGAGAVETPSSAGSDEAAAEAPAGAEDLGDQASPAMPDGAPVVEAAPIEAPAIPEAERREHSRSDEEKSQNA